MIQFMLPEIDRELEKSFEEEPVEEEDDAFLEIPGQLCFSIMLCFNLFHKFYA